LSTLLHWIKDRISIKGWWQQHRSLAWILGALALAFPPLVVGGYPQTHSLEYNLIWVYQFDQQFLAGQLYPRWLEQSWGSLGSPSFSFYPPMCMVATLPFALLGWDLTARLVGSMGLALVVMGIGAYVYGCCLFHRSDQRWLAGVTAALAILSPYFLENIYIRGALGEVWAMAWLPWVLWASYRSLEKSSRWRIAGLALTYAGLALSHLPTLLIFTLLWGLLPLLMTRRWSQFWRWGMRLYGPLLVGLALTSFYLLPAALDQQWVSLQHLGFANPFERTLLQGLTRLDPAPTQHDYDQALLPMFWLTILIGVIAAWFLRSRSAQWPQALRRQAIVLLVGSSFALIMMTDLGAAIYTLVPVLQRIQFAWRWMVITGVLLPFLIGLILLGDQRRVQRSWQRIRAGGLILLLATWAFGTNLQHIPFHPQRMQDLDHYFAARPAFPLEADLTAKPLNSLGRALWINRDQELILEDVWEYLPRWVKSTQLPSRSYDLVEWQTGSGQIHDLVWRFGQRHFRVESSTEGLLKLRMFAWPGWRISVNGRAIALQMDTDYRLQVPIPKGSTTVEIRYRGTQSERWGWIVSGVAWLAGILYLIPWKQLRKWLLL
jgi:hypothetical protein